MSPKSAALRRPNGSGRLSAEEAAKLPDRLLDAAAEMFRERGYGGTSMEGIARLAGASTKTLYSRYRNKNEILQAVVRRLTDRALPDLDDLVPTVDAVDVRQLLLQVGMSAATLVTSAEARMIYRLAVAEAPRFPEMARVYRDGTGRRAMLLGRLFQRLHDARKLILADKPEDAAMVFIDLTVATPRNRAALGTPLSPAALKAYVTTAVEFFLRGCGPRRA